MIVHVYLTYHPIVLFFQMMHVSVEYHIRKHTPEYMQYNEERWNDRRCRRL